VAWTNPAPITYGAPLTSNQLNAVTSVPGELDYFPTNGTVLDTGSNTLSVLFTPADAIDYSTVSASVIMLVLPAPLSVTATNVTQAYGPIEAPFTGAITGVTNGDNITATYSCSATNNSPPGIYPIVPGLVDPNNRQTNYAVTLNNGTLTITMGSPVVSWTNPVPITYGAALTSNQLNAVANIPGSFSYLPTNGTVLDTGTNTISVLFTPADSVDYGTVFASLDVVVLPAPLTVTAFNTNRPVEQMNPIFTGSTTGLTNGDDIGVLYSCSATNDSQVGTYPIVPSLLDPDNRQTNYSVTLVSGTLTVTGSPILAWTNPAPITYGAPLTSNQLNATTSVPGEFVYIPSNGVVLDAGTNMISVQFSPADATDFGIVSETVSIVVLPAPLTVTASNATKPYGSPETPFTGTLTGVTNNDTIAASYSCSASNNSPPGIYSIVPSLVDPNNFQTNYAVTLNDGTLTITMGVPALVWANPVPITYGAALTSNQLNATVNIPGSFTYIPTNGTVLDAGTNTISVLFTPADIVDYSTASESVSMVVLPASLTVTASNASRAFGQANPVFTGSISGVTNGNDITFILSCSATNDSPVGIYPLVPSLVDPDDRQTNYSVTLINGSLAVGGAPVLAWTNPAPITYGTPLTSNQLNASTSVPGEFVYLPTNSSVLDVGTNVVSLLFNPADTVDFSNVTASVILVVLPAPLTVTASNVSQPYGTSETLTGTITGVTNNDNITAIYNSSATSNSPPGTYPIVPSLVDPNNRQTNYAVTLNDGTLTITMGVPALVWTNPVPITYGAPLTSNQLNAALNLAGSFAYIPTNGTFLDAGTNVISVIFTPLDNVDYATGFASVSMVVLPGTLTVTASNASRSFGQSNPVFTGSMTGLTNGDDITLSLSCIATNNSLPGSYPIIPGLVDPDDRQTNYVITLINGTLSVMALPQIQNVQTSSNSFVFTWTAASNQLYQIQTTTDLTLTNWTAVGGELTASNSTMTVSEPLGTNVQQFYRILLLP